MSGMHVRFEVSPEQFLADLTEAAYQVSVRHGFQAPFIQVELELWDALREVLRKDTLVSDKCGSSTLGVCREACQFEPWSKEAKNLELENSHSE